MPEVDGMTYINDYKGYRIYWRGSFMIMDGHDFIQRGFATHAECEKVIDQIIMFKFVRDNLRLTIEECNGRDFGGPGGMYNFRGFTVKLIITNPETEKDEILSSEQFSISVD